MANRLEGKVIAVTGAGSGIGAATANLLASSGALVAALDLKWPEAGTMRDPATGFFRGVDVVGDDGVERVFDDIVRHFGKLDGLATCAGVNNIDSFDQLEAACFGECTKSTSSALSTASNPRRLACPRVAEWLQFRALPASGAEEYSGPERTRRAKPQSSR